MLEAGTIVYGRTRTVHTDLASWRAKQVRPPQQEWKIRVPDVYSASISWATFEQIQGMLADNYAAYDRNKTRAAPRRSTVTGNGGLWRVWHRMVIEYQHGTRYLCNYLRQQYRVPVCHSISADAVDAQVVEAFFQALFPLELDVYKRAVAAQQAEETQVEHANQQRLACLRYEVGLAQRQFLQVGPENHLVAAELEKPTGCATRYPCCSSLFTGFPSVLTSCEQRLEHLNLVETPTRCAMRCSW